LRVFDYGGHACTITKPKIFNDLLLTHLSHYDAK
jgi:aminoacrylate hydrolase